MPHSVLQSSRRVEANVDIRGANLRPRAKTILGVCLVPLLPIDSLAGAVRGNHGHGWRPHGGVQNYAPYAIHYVYAALAGYLYHTG